MLNFKKLEKHGYPITKMGDGDPALEEIKMYEIPYLKDEINNLVMWFKDNKK